MSVGIGDVSLLRSFVESSLYGPLSAAVTQPAEDSKESAPERWGAAPARSAQRSELGGAHIDVLREAGPAARGRADPIGDVGEAGGGRQARDGVGEAGVGALPEQ